MISGASHLEVPTAPGVAATVKLGSEMMGANPYSVKRARPLRSTTTFACRHGISTFTRLGTREKGILTPQVQQSRYNLRGRGDNFPPSNPRAEYRANEGTATPSQHQAATLWKEKKVSNLL